MLGCCRDGDSAGQFDHSIDDHLFVDADPVYVKGLHETLGDPCTCSRSACAWPRRRDGRNGIFDGRFIIGCEMKTAFDLSGIHHTPCHECSVPERVGTSSSRTQVGRINCFSLDACPSGVQRFHGEA